jgi:hypothetical protein
MPGVITLAERFTVYVVEDDPLLNIAAMSGGPRAGSTVAPVEGVDVIEVPGDFRLNPIAGLLPDIYALLAHGLPPEKRLGLRRLTSIGGAVWSLSVKPQ